MVHQKTQLKGYIRLFKEKKRRILGSRALDKVVEALGVDRETAQEFIDDEVLRIVPRSFVQTIEQPYRGAPYPADIFGHIDDEGRHWYIKLFIDVSTDCVVMSFHPPDHPLKRQDGKELLPWKT